MHMTKGILARHSIGTVFVEKRKAKFGRTLNSLPSVNAGPKSDNSAG
jgi:hypothetical protein